jgi:hypothetical protein
MAEHASYSERRRTDPYLDRRSGEDRRDFYLVDYFAAGGPERRKNSDRRRMNERREGCVRVTRWSSVCAGKITRTSDR